MIEIRFHGRGGQGAVVASKILAVAFFKEGRYPQSFPAFGVERRGAPVAAFLRVDDSKIYLRSNIYTPDHIVVLDSTLVAASNVTEGLKEGGWIIINSPLEPAGLRDKLGGYRVATVDASKIAVELRLGSRTAPIVNTAILGSFARATGLVGLDSVMESIMEEAPINPKGNAQAAKLAYDQTILGEL